MANVNDQHSDLDAQLKKLQIEEMTERIAKSKADKEARKKSSAQQEAALAQANADQKRRQQFCNHRKGGKNREGMDNGDDTKYAVNKQTIVDGTIYVMCTRCQKEWWPGNPDYADAMRWPTDNEPAGAITFSGTMPFHSQDKPVATK